MKRSANEKILSIAVNAAHLDRLAEIAKGEHRNLSQKIRLMIEAEVTATQDGA